ncbi:MAG: DUF2946 domain-containing protein [Xanthobacteraceae bacterium]|nr:DUF2946 domain-containing protein [Xanthobacteraceae bacterium]
MRRRLGTYIPIVMFAVLMQMFAPIGATWAAASAYGDPLGFAPICSSQSDHDDTTGNSSGQPTSHSTCCPLCVLAHASSTALAPTDAPFAALQISWQRVVWLADHPVPLSRSGASHAQARAPPVYS